MTFFGKDTKPEITEAQNLIIDLAKKLRKMPGGRYVLAIVTAKVPIVKFEFRPTSTVIVDCDICLYNTLALENTAMLQMYSQIDPRVKVRPYKPFWVSSNILSKISMFKRKVTKNMFEKKYISFSDSRLHGQGMGQGL